MIRVGAHILEARRLHDRKASAKALWPWVTALLTQLRIPDRRSGPGTSRTSGAGGCCSGRRSPARLPTTPPC